jgi:hypothetical protein
MDGSTVKIKAMNWCNVNRNGGTMSMVMENGNGGQSNGR